MWEVLWLIPLSQSIPCYNIVFCFHIGRAYHYQLKMEMERTGGRGSVMVRYYLIATNMFLPCQSSIEPQSSNKLTLNRYFIRKFLFFLNQEYYLYRFFHLFACLYYFFFYVLNVFSQYFPTVLFIQLHIQKFQCEHFNTPNISFSNDPIFIYSNQVNHRFLREKSSSPSRIL